MMFVVGHPTRRKYLKQIMTMYNVGNKNAEYLKYFPVRLDYRQSNCAQQSESAECLGNLQIARIPKFPGTNVNSSL